MGLGGGCLERGGAGVRRYHRGGVPRGSGGPAPSAAGRAPRWARQQAASSQGTGGLGSGGARAAVRAHGGAATRRGDRQPCAAA